MSTQHLKYNMHANKVHLSLLPTILQVTSLGSRKVGITKPQSSWFVRQSFSPFLFVCLVGGDFPATYNYENPSREAKSNRSMAFPISRWDGGIRSRS